ncbi:hypothetical protein K4K58_003404 [Colletotrichum sp. SAR11_239]|nr:hypothetical protein K4K58_003404 [Colletotrichum sp. SAR11_239]
MADPLSVAASIAGLVSLADVVFTRLVKYGKAVKNAEKELKELTKDVNLLGGSLDSLSRLARALDDGTFHSNFRMDYIDDCNETLEEMKEKLGKLEAKSAKTRIFWSVTSSHLKAWREDISRHQGMISTALSADTLQALLQILSHENRQVEEILSEIRDTRSIVSRVDKESRRSKNDNAYKVLVQYYDELHPKQGLPRSTGVSSLKVLLHSILEMYEHVYLILDGLDECGNMTEDVIDALIDTFDEADNVSVALLSRDEDGIRDRLSGYCVSIEVAAHKHDIMEYVTAQIQERIRVGKLSAYGAELKAEIIQGLVDGAKGM